MMINKNIKIVEKVKSRRFTIKDIIYYSIQGMDSLKAMKAGNYGAGDGI